MVLLWVGQSLLFHYFLHISTIRRILLSFNRITLTIVKASSNRGFSFIFLLLNSNLIPLGIWGPLEKYVLTYHLSITEVSEVLLYPPPPYIASAIHPPHLWYTACLKARTLALRQASIRCVASCYALIALGGAYEER